MVDINLIGDDRTGEEERVDDFTQTSSMDTQELAFEERTETFDTTKTAGFTPKRSYSPLISTLIILAVVGLLGGSIYFFMFAGDDTDPQLDIPTYEPPENENEFATEGGDAELDELSRQFADDIADLNTEDQQPAFSEPETQTFSEPVSQPQRQPATSQPPVQSTAPPPLSTSDLDPVSSDFVANTRETVQTVTNILTSIPTNLNVSLLSYTRRRVRLEFVASTASDARNFTNTLNQNFGSGNLAVVSESKASSNSGVFDKVLISGTVAGNGIASSSGGVRFMNLGQAKDWINSSARQFGLTVRQLAPQQGSFTNGYQKTPILARIYGNQSSIVGLLEEIAAQSYNIELAKVLLVSPDVITFSDDNLHL